MKTDLTYEEFKKYEIEIPAEWKNSFKMFGESYDHRFKFENGYGASVIKHYGSYGYQEDEFELAVLKFDEDGTESLCYNTPITDNVIGWLTNDEVLETLNKIKNLEVN